MAGSRHGLGLGSLIVIGCLLYYSGIGGVLAERAGNGLVQLEAGCYTTLAQVAGGKAQPVCGVLGGSVRFIGKTLGTLGTYLSDAKRATIQGIRSVSGGKDVDISEITSSQFWRSVSLPNGGALESLSSSADALAEKMRNGPMQLPSGGSVRDQVRNALDNYVIGQQHLTGGGSVRDALPWLQQGATTPGYGVLSQISLGDIYSQGTGGMAPDPGRAAFYYGQAAQSIDTLQANGSKQSKELLRSLGGSPEEVKQRLNIAAAKLKTGR